MTTIYNMLRVYTRELVLEDGCTEMGTLQYYKQVALVRWLVVANSREGEEEQVSYV